MTQWRTRVIFDNAQVCRNGHLITDVAKSNPQLREKYCHKCGEPTFLCCPACEVVIRGRNLSPGHHYYGVPAYCHNCGKPYPWTEAKLKAVHELVLELAISAQEKEQLSQSIDDIVQDTPHREIAVEKVKTIMTKVGPGTALLFKDMLVGVVAAGIAKAIWE